MKNLRQLFNRRFIDVKLPLWLRVTLIAIFSLGIIGALAYLFSYARVGEAATLLVLTLTLIAVAMYVYYNYLVAYDIWAPLSFFYLEQDKDDPYQVLIILRNESKQTIRLFVDLRAMIYNSQSLYVDIDGRYAPTHVWELEPLSQAKGIIKITDILKKANFTTSSMEKAASIQKEQNSQLRFSLKVKYLGLRANVGGYYPAQNYYFDFTRKELVLNV